MLGLGIVLLEQSCLKLVITFWTIMVSISKGLVLGEPFGFVFEERPNYFKT